MFRTGFVGRQVPAGSSYQPSMSIDLTRPTLDPRLTFTRNTIATDSFYTDAAGTTYNTYPAQQPRIFGAKGMLFEESRTNWLLNSDAPATQTTGSLTAVNYVLWVIGTGSATVAAGTATISAGGTATAGVPFSFSVSVAGTVTVTVTGSLNRFQLEGNGVYPTSYIPTTGATVARAGEFVSMAAGSWFNAVNGSLYSEFMIDSRSVIGAGIASVPVQLDDGTNNNVIQLRLTGGSALNVGSSVFAANALTGSSGTPVNATQSVYDRAAATYNATTTTVCNNGSAVQSAAISTLPTVNRLVIGSGRTLPLSGYIRSAQYWPRVLSNTEMQALTTLGTLDTSLDMDFTTGVLDKRITFVRASIATYHDNTGLVKTAASGAPRFDYDPITLQPRGLLVEEARTNLYGFSSDMSNMSTNPTPNDCLFVQNAAVGPDGTMTAAAHVPSTTSGSHIAYRSLAGMTTSTTYIWSAWIKAAGYRYMLLQCGGSGFAAQAWATFDTVAGNVTNLGSGAIAAGTIPYPNGWYRVWVSATTLSSAGTYVPNFTISITPTTGTVFAGDGVSGIYVFGAQMEAGSYITSYVPTVSSTVARSGDAATMVPGPWYNTATSSLASEFMINYLPSATNPCPWGLDDGTVNNAFIHRVQGGGGGNMQAVIWVANAVTGSQATIAYTPGAFAKAGAGFSATRIQTALNGTLTASAASAMPAGISRLSIGNGRSGILTGWIRRLRYWPRQLADAELIQVTT